VASFDDLEDNLEIKPEAAAMETEAAATETEAAATET
jgi:hypothetical protein